MTRVLVTGADGFIGRHVTKAMLAGGREVHAVSRHDHGDEPVSGIDWHTIDLFEPGQVEALLARLKPTHLVHLAWITTPGEYWQSPENEAWRHASSRLLESFAKHGGRRALVSGTCAEYDWRDGICIEDVTPTRSMSPYSEAKLALHDELAAMARTANFELVWARLFFLFGPHERPERLLPSVINKLLAGERADCSDGEQVRDFLYVRDVASAVVRVLEHEFCGDINIASGKARTVREIVSLVAEKLDATDRVDFGSKTRRDNEPSRIVADITRLKEVIGWSPDHQLETAIDESIAWWRGQRSMM